MTTIHLNNSIDIITESSKNTNTEMKYLKESLKKLSDRDIRLYYKENRENMIEPFTAILKGFEKRIAGNIESIDDLLHENITSEQIEKLNKSKELEEESLKIIAEIYVILDDIMEHRLNKAIVGTLEDIAYETVKKEKVTPETVSEKAVLEQQSKKGGLRKSNNRKNNKKYTKKTPYEKPKKYVSKKNNTRKIKKNYL